MVQKLFSLYTHPEQSHQLHVEVGKTHMALWCNGTEEAFTALEYFTFSYDNTEGSFVDVFREIKRGSILLKYPFTAPEIVWENATFMCVPNLLFKQEETLAYTSLTTSQSFQSPPMYKAMSSFTVAYTADAVLYKIMSVNLPGATHTHKFEHLLQQQKVKSATALYLQFYQSHFLLTAVKNNVLQLATVYAFTTPHEALYHIVNTMDKLSLQTDDTTVFLAGFIDEASSLYKEMYQYVANLTFTQTGKLNNEYPAHYFSTFNLPSA